MSTPIPDVQFKGHIDSIQRGAGQAFSILPAQNATGNYVKVVQRVPVRIEFDREEWPRSEAQISDRSGHVGGADRQGPLTWQRHRRES